MKKILFVLCAAVISFVSCSKMEDTGKIVNAPVFTATTELSQTKTSLDGVHVNWTVGDYVSICGTKYSATPQSVATNADFTYIEGAIPGAAPYWALYPYDGSSKSGDDYVVTVPVSQTYTAGTFATASLPMIAVSDTRTLAFKNAGAVLVVTPSSSWNGIQVKQLKVSANEFMAGEATVVYNGTGEPAVTATGSKSVTLDCGNGVDFGTPLYLAIAPGTYTGLTFEVTATNGGVYTMTATSSYTILRNCKAAFAVTANEIVCDLSHNIMDTPGFPESTETANTYLIKKNGSYKFPVTVRGNGVAIDSYSIDTDITGQTASVQKLFGDGSLESTTFSLSSDGNYIEFSTSNTDALQPGTAIVAAKNSSDEIIWSWTIWVSPDISELTYNGITFLDRFLGAFHSGATADLHEGFYYQSGRKDPLPQKADIKSKTISSAWTFDGGPIEEGEDGITMSIANPLKLINYSDIVYRKPWSYVYHPDSWNRNYLPIGLYHPVVFTDQNPRTQTCIKTMFDPSPVGYHVISGNGADAINRAGIFCDNRQTITIGSGADAFVFPNPLMSYGDHLDGSVGNIVYIYTCNPDSESCYWGRVRIDNDTTTYKPQVTTSRVACVVLCQKD